MPTLARLLGSGITGGMTRSEPHRVSKDELPKRLQRYCDAVRFVSGEVIRQKGQHYPTMFLVTSGQVEVDLGMEGGALRPPIGPSGVAIGEIGFLRGLPATATVRAVTDVAALQLNDDVLSKIETTEPEVAVALLQFLANTAEERISQNIEINEKSADPVKEQSIRVVLCRNEDMLAEAQKLRYRVYCEELGRTSPNAVHKKKIIADDRRDPSPRSPGIVAWAQMFVIAKQDDADFTPVDTCRKPGEPMRKTEQFIGFDVG